MKIFKNFKNVIDSRRERGRIPKGEKTASAKTLGQERTFSNPKKTNVAEML